MNRAFLLTFICACATATGAEPAGGWRFAQRTQVVPAPVAPKASEWKIGQWAAYAIGDIGYIKVTVVAEDRCGMWIEEEFRFSSGGDETALICLRPMRPQEDPLEQLQLVIRRNKDDTVSTFDFRTSQNTGGRQKWAALVRTLMPPDWSATAKLESQREDVDVPAGHFLGVIRTTKQLGATSKRVAWIHPDVPFDGTVKSTDDGFETVLVAYGENAPSTIGERLAMSPRRGSAGRAFISVGGGVAGLTGPTVPPNGAFALSTQAGQPVGPRVDLTEEVKASGVRFPPSTMQREGFAHFLLGVRWKPLQTSEKRFRRFEPRDVYLQGDLGGSVLLGGDTVAIGGVVGGGVGWLPFGGDGWRFGIQASDHVGIYRSEGIVNSFDFMMITQMRFQ